jgi:LmbE family N-acetylglucosaminyl deacetylase
MSCTILILSPHLDDAALSCAEHIKLWRDQDLPIHVTTVFTEFGSQAPSAYMKRFMSPHGCHDAVEYGRVRREEDRQAMEVMQVTFSHAGFVDAGFRQSKDGPLYRDYRALTSWRIGEEARPIFEQVKALFHQWPVPGLIVSPLGVGGHIDHLLVREAALAVWNGKTDTAFYVEFPYGLRPWKYRPCLVRYLRGQQISLKGFSLWKHGVIGRYQTQVPHLFRRKPGYLEVIFLPRKFRHKTKESSSSRLWPGALHLIAARIG